MENDELDQPSQNTQRPQQEKKQKKSLYNQFKQLKNIYNNAKTVVNVVKTAASFSNPWVIGTVVVIIIIIILFMFFFNKSVPSSTDGLPTTPLPPGVSININSYDPTLKDEKSVIHYTISASLNPNTSGATKSIENVVVYDELPANTTFVREGSSTFCSLSGNTINCPLKGQSNPASITILLQPTKNDIIVTNIINARVIEGSTQTATSSASQGVQGASINTQTQSCNSLYDLSKNPLDINFGDPNCDFSKSDLYEKLKNLDPQHADFLYYNVASCSGFDPNFYFTNPKTGEEKYGLFRLPSSAQNTNFFGNTMWEQQVKNVVSLEKADKNYFDSFSCTN